MMSSTLFASNARVLRGLVSLLGFAALAIVMASPAARAQTFPVPEHCQVDLGGANDRPGQRDVTQFCVDEADGLPYELFALTNIDEIRSGGANTIDVCFLLDSDDDAFVNQAVCATIRGDDGGPTFLGMVRLFSCIDTKSDRCMASVPVSGTHETDCEVRHPDSDPFSPAAPGGPGDEYPLDTELLCAIDLDDFSAAGGVLRLVDACSYPSASPNSDPGDCVVFSDCAAHAECDDGNPCTDDRCGLSGTCSHRPLSGIPCDDGMFCTVSETCNNLGFCTAGEPRTCDDTVACTVDDCDELDDVCVHDARDSLCSDDLSCNGVETCDPSGGCAPGLPTDCTDGVACTADSCDESTDSCTHAPADAGGIL